MTVFTSTTALQREGKKILDSDSFFQIVLTNNEFSGIVIPKKSAQKLMDSGVFEQLEEELWELEDKETCRVIEEGRKNPEKGITFSDFRKSHGI